MVPDVGPRAAQPPWFALEPSERAISKPVTTKLQTGYIFSTLVLRHEHTASAARAAPQPKASVCSVPAASWFHFVEEPQHVLPGVVGAFAVGVLVFNFRAFFFCVAR